MTQMLSGDKFNSSTAASPICFCVHFRALNFEYTCEFGSLQLVNNAFAAHAKCAKLHLKLRLAYLVNRLSNYNEIWVVGSKV